MTERESRIVPFPRSRKLVVDACRYGKRQHTIYGLLEVDVTEPRRRIRDHAGLIGEPLSFTAFVAGCLARTVAEDPSIQAYRDWRGRLVIFDEVDVNAIVERRVHGVVMGSVHVIRGAERKSVEAIHAELREAKESEVRAREHRVLYLYLFLPGFVRGWLWRILGRFPRFVKRTAGTVSVTAVGMYVEGGGWGIGIGSHTLGIAIGGIEEKPRAVDGRVEIREILNLTLAFDHDVVDGAPAARFASQLKERIERGDELPG